MNIKLLVKQIVPPLCLVIYRSFRDLFVNKKDEIELRRDFMKRSVNNVEIFINEFKNLTDVMLLDAEYMERFVYEKIGLNNETLSEQPCELNDYFGKGLFIWQYPKQFAKFIVWLSKNAKNYNSYIEIGCRWGGTFIVICEVLKRANPNFKFAIAADIIDQTPFIEKYIELNNQSEFKVHYFKGSSLSDEYKAMVEKMRPEVAFIDGDHSLRVALQDHMNVREFAKIIVHHDINSDACPETVKLWEILKQLEVNRKSIEFSDQYDSVNGSYLGIGLLHV